MSFLRFFRKKPETETSRLARLAQAGRIADGAVIDVKVDDNRNITHIFYTYVIAGVEYESSQELSVEQKTESSRYAPGTDITIRYDPRQPGNSMVV
jgi:hypothetical protein